MAVVLHQPASILREPEKEAWDRSTSRHTVRESTAVQELLEAACLNFVGFQKLTEARSHPDKRKRGPGPTPAHAKGASHSAISHHEHIGTGNFGKQDGGDDDRDRDYDDNRTGDIPKVPSAQEGRRFACHFQRHDGHSPGNPARVCSHGFQSIRRIKEHLRRIHLVHCCRFCSMTYRSREKLRDHRATGEHAHLDSDVEAWRNIYRCLFPSESIPIPYVTESEELVPILMEEPIPPESQVLENRNQGLLSTAWPTTPTLPMQFGLQSIATPFQSTNLDIRLSHQVGSQHVLELHSSTATSQHASERGHSSVSGHDCSVCAATDAMDNLAEILEELSSSFLSFSAVSSHTVASKTHAGASPPSQSSGGSEGSGKGTGSGKAPQKSFRGQRNLGGRGRGRGNGRDRPPINLPPSQGDSLLGLICCYHRENPDVFGINGPNTLHHKCETRGWSLLGDLLHHYWNLHKAFICGKCLNLFPSDQERKDHTRENSHCHRCFTAFPKAPDTQGNLHHSDEYSNHGAQGCQSPYVLGDRVKYQWHKCCELIFGHFGQDYDPYFRTMMDAQIPAVASVDGESGGAEPSEMSVALPEDEARRLQAENTAQSETIASLRRETEELRASLASAEQRQNSLILSMSNICQLLGNSPGILTIGPNLQEQMNFWQNQQREQGLPVAESFGRPLNQTDGNDSTGAPLSQVASPAQQGFNMGSFTAEQNPLIDAGSNSPVDFNAADFWDAQMDTSALDNFDLEYMDFNVAGQTQAPPVQTSLAELQWS